MLGRSKFAVIIALNYFWLRTLSVGTMCEKCVFCALVSNIFAADLESHTDCMKACVLTFK